MTTATTNRAPLGERPFMTYTLIGLPILAAFAVASCLTFWRRQHHRKQGSPRSPMLAGLVATSADHPAHVPSGVAVLSDAVQASDEVFTPPSTKRKAA
jgi:hypothetical protein